MKRFLSMLILGCCCLVVFSQSIKVNYKDEIRPYKFKIEKIEIKGGETTITIKVKQQQNFSYTILFEDCWLSSDSNAQIKGRITTWNGEKRVSNFPKPISDQEDEKFSLTFSGSSILNADKFDIKIGTIQDKNKTEIIFRDVPLKK